MIGSQIQSGETERPQHIGLIPHLTNEGTEAQQRDQTPSKSQIKSVVELTLKMMRWISGVGGIEVDFKELLKNNPAHSCREINLR